MQNSKLQLKIQNLTGLSLTETINGLETKQFSEEELNKAYLERIKKYNSKLNAYLLVNEDVKGIPVAIKDSICTKDIKTTAASKILDNFIPPYNATAVERLLSQNIGILGKTNCDEFTMGASGENSAYGPTKNPWNLGKVPGGSSSGSAVAVASDLCVFSLGTDTGGSIRFPSSLCGVVGLKPSYGRVSRYGAISMASSFDQIGPIAKTVNDARLILEWISGPDGYDSNCHPEIFSGSKMLKVQSDKLKNIRVGVPKEYFGKGLDAGVEKVIKDAIKKLKELGAEIIDITLPHAEYSVPAYYVLVSSEISSNYSRFDGIRFGFERQNFGDEVKRRIMLGTYALSSGYYDDYYAKAAKVRTLIKKDFDGAFEKCDVIVGPVSPTVAWDLKAKVDDPLAMYLCDIYTSIVNLAGIPGLSIPCGFSNELPVGLQIIGKYMDEQTILTVGEVYENAMEWNKSKPNL